MCGCRRFAAGRPSGWTTELPFDLRFKSREHNLSRRMWPWYLLVVRFVGACEQNGLKVSTELSKSSRHVICLEYYRKEYEKYRVFRKRRASKEGLAAFELFMKTCHFCFMISPPEAGYFPEISNTVVMWLCNYMQLNWNVFLERPCRSKFLNECWELKWKYHVNSKWNWLIP